MIALNFPYMKNHRSIKPPSFVDYTFLTDTLFKPLYFAPNIEYDTVYKLKAQAIVPVTVYPNRNGGAVYPLDLYPQSPRNTLTIDTNTGAMFWNAPQYYGTYMVSYRLSIYKDSVFVCSMTRDFMVNVFDSTSVNTGIKNIDPATISIYPNPAFDRINIRGLPHDAAINISDMTGRICISQTATDQINISALSSGIYYLSIQDQDGVITKKFVKQ